MIRYRTEVVVTTDRYVCLQLPGHFPEGQATVIVSFLDPSRPGASLPLDGREADQDDIEWWDEFEGENVSAG